MKRCCVLSRMLSAVLIMGLMLAAPSVQGQSRPPGQLPILAPSTLDGELWAAECLAAPRTSADCNRRALQAGKPGGLLIGRGQFTLLLLDGRILRHGCPQSGQPPQRVRAQGFLHKDGHAMSVVHLQALCGTNWQVVNLPYAGTEEEAAEVGNE